LNAKGVEKMANAQVTRKMICHLHPFDLNQKLFVYQDGNKIDYAEVKIDEVTDQILAFCDKYYLSKISFLGPSQYIRGIGKRIKENFLTNYDREIEIEYLNS
jgi:hypothetical protein